MKNIISIFILILSLQHLPAIIISEVELNPKGTDSGNEWIELYSEVQTNLDDYILINNDKNNLSLQGSFTGSYVYTFNSQWLDNTNESVFLYKNNELIDSTPILQDSKNNDLTWQFCDGWEFKISTKEDNNCNPENITESDTKEQNETQEEKPQEEIKDTPKTENKEEDTENKKQEKKEIIETKQPEIKKEPTKIENKIINLSPQNIKSKDYNENLSKKDYAKYGLSLFCILLFGLFTIKKTRLRKNEFR